MSDATRILALLLLAACAGPTARAGAPADTAASRAASTPPAEAVAPEAPAAAEPLSFVSTLARFQIAIPPVWGRRFSVSERAEPAEYPGATHVVEFLYLPRETSVPPTILGIVAYDAAGWSAVKGGAGRPRGDVIAEQDGRVFVATRQANPFAKGSVDALAFDSLQVSTAQVRQAFSPR